MTSGGPRPRSARQELSLALLLGAAGAAIVFLATRQGWAQVRTSPPRPLPASRVTVTGAGLVPYADALALTSLASLAAVVASRGVLRRVTGLLLVVLGAVLAGSVLSLSGPGAIAAAAANASPAGTAGAGSVTQGGTPASSVIPNVAGAASQVTFNAVGWQILAVTGAILLVAAGALVMWRANRMAVMSSRYDAPASAARTAVATPAGAGDRSDQPGVPDRQGGGAPAGPAPVRARSQGTARSPDGEHGPGPLARPVGPGEPAAGDSAAIWDALSRGDDPTSAAAYGDRYRAS